MRISTIVLLLIVMREGAAQNLNLNAPQWKAKWITTNSVRTCPVFRKEFNAKKKIISATAYITAHGLYHAEINGQKIGNAYLTPGWTVYSKRMS